jgi:omega-amidase
VKINLAVVQVRSHYGPDEERNVEQALDWLARAAEKGADLVVFPEGYPGPASQENHYEALEPLAERARELGVHVVAGRNEPAPDGYSYVTLQLIDDQGSTLGVYRRTTPLGPYVYRDIEGAPVDYMASNSPPSVIPTRLGRIGMLVCSEVYVPELSRLLALQAADVIVYPAGGTINEFLPSWRTMLWARAIENLTYTAACQNLYEQDEEGVAQIAGPERVLKSSTTEGVIMAELDFERLAWLRSEQERLMVPKPWDTIPGVLRWRRPELYEALVAQNPPLTTE